MLRAKIALAAMAAMSLGLSAPAVETTPELIPELGKQQPKFAPATVEDDTVCAVAYQDGPNQILAREKDVPKGAKIVAVYTATKKECARLGRLPSVKAQKRGTVIHFTAPAQPK
ncbi:MAG: hypothetical protein JNN11_03780 [Candidatus Doudnabacteria bacterium]|nr:hypothetical protein [Candidatus Doudnabacteria bacterium]